MLETSFDLRGTIARHPWQAVAIAFAAGAAMAVAERSRSALVRAAGLAAGNVLVTIARERGARELAKYARSWLDERVRVYAPPATA